MTLHGRTALITGGGGPLGRAFALALAGAGARVILVGRGERALADAAARVAKEDGGARTAVCDVSDSESVRALALELADEEVSLLVKTPESRDRYARSPTSSPRSGTRCSPPTSAGCT
ncbi:SDR family NAD(P)-dependent oxidoreductase [Streptomyces mirabilis]|uniref:SDR family NAD(P)-dependent oxidoreductase n=1 Tax=Streptomyces mirabilis TaxID=68239 RepID=UPI0033AD1247